MKISKRVSFGAALLALAYAAGAPAVEPTAEATAAAAEPTVEATVPAAEPTIEATAPAAEPAAEATTPAAEAVAPEEAQAPAAEAAPLAPQAAGGEAEPPAPALGAIGHDAEGRPGRVHLVARGDTLWDISEAYLGTPWVWPSIWKDNQAIQNPHLIRPGDRIWITPSEMRRVTAEEAAALLAGQPAAPQPEAEAAVEEPAAPPTPLAAPEPEARNALRVSSQDAVGLVTPDELEVAGSIVSSVPSRVMLSQGDQVFVGMPEGDTQKGNQYTIFRVRENVVDPDSGRLLGHHVEFLGWLEIEQTHPESALAVIRESVGEIAVHDRMLPRTPAPAEIAVQESPGDVDGKISFFANKRTVMGTADFVYLNRGALDGLEVGSPLEVYRESFLADETTRNQRVRVPERVVAQLLVVKAEPMTSVAFITHTDEELELGDRFRGAQE